MTVLMQIAAGLCNWTLHSYKLHVGTPRFGLEVVGSEGNVVRGDSSEYPNQAILRGLYTWMKLARKVDLLYETGV